MNKLKLDHPMPDKVRKKWQSLNGLWDFSFDEPVFDKKINVPFSWTCPLSGINEPKKKGKGYYRRYVEYKITEDKLYIVFCGVDYECRVYVNGVLLKEHFGGYGLFDVDVTHVWNNDTLLYNIAFIFIGVVLAVMFAILLNELASKIGRKVYQTVMLMPHFLSYVIVSYLVFSFLSGENGILNNTILPFFGIEPVEWYAESKYWPYILTIS